MSDVYESGVLQNEANISFDFNGELGFVTLCSVEGDLCFFRTNRSKSLSLAESRRQASCNSGRLSTAEVGHADWRARHGSRLDRRVCSGKLHPTVAGGMATRVEFASVGSSTDQQDFSEDAKVVGAKVDRRC
jgi:hypothetical protein